MSKIINEAKIKNPLVVKIRELLEHRAFWLYLLTDEAEKRGLKKTLFTKAARWVFEMDVVESTDNTLYLDFH